MEKRFYNGNCTAGITDHGLEPFAGEIGALAKRNGCFRTALWTGNHLQVTLMSIPAGEDIGLEVHPYVDQLLLIEEGYGLTEMGPEKESLTYRKAVRPGYAVLVPAGNWHNVTNQGRGPLKLISVYGPANHPHGTVHETKEIAEAAEEK